MKSSAEEIYQLIELAKEGEQIEPINWDELSVTEDTVYQMMGEYVLQMDPDPLIQKSILVKLLVENFALKIKLKGKK